MKYISTKSKYILLIFINLFASERTLPAFLRCDPSIYVSKDILIKNACDRKHSLKECVLKLVFY